MSVEGKTSGGDGSESWFRGVADSISDLLSVFDGEGRFLYANPAWQSTMGYSCRWMSFRCATAMAPGG